MSGAGYVVRLARVEEAGKLPDIEKDASILFESEFDVSSFKVTPLDVLERVAREGTLWVAADGDDEPVGFLAAEPRGGTLYLGELDVLRTHQRRGLGRRLIQAACDHARRAGLSAVTLTTDRFVSWNMPYYLKLGFRALDEAQLPDFLRAALEKERRDQPDGDRRVAMIKNL